MKFLYRIIASKNQCQSSINCNTRTSKKLIPDMLAEFIEIYRSETCLWKIRSKEYHDRTRKEAAYDKLCVKLQKLEPNATKKTDISKLNSLRSSFRKEWKKVQESKKSGSGTDNIYKSNLWYYDRPPPVCRRPGSSQNINECEVYP